MGHHRHHRLTWFCSAPRTPPKLLKKMKIVILLLAVLATIDAAAVQNVKAADKPAAVKAADLPKPTKVEDLVARLAEKTEDLSEEDMEDLMRESPFFHHLLKAILGSEDPFLHHLLKHIFGSEDPFFHHLTK